MKNLIYFLTAILLLAVASIFISKTRQHTALPATPTPTPFSALPETTKPTVAATAEVPIVFATPKKTPHYVSNVPAHGVTLASTPSEIRINFNFDVAAPSSISITKNGTEYGTGDTKIGSDKLSLTQLLSTDMSNGLYTVTYKACWPDKSCHDGNFQFALKK